MAHAELAPEIGYRRLTVRPVTGALGAEIFGVDLTQPIDAETKREIIRAFHDHLVIWFPDQKPLAPEQHLAFAELFGPLTRIPHIFSIEGYPEIQIVRREANESGTYVVGENWHSDSTFLETPPLGVVMRAIDVPEFGGDTLFANMYLAYEALSDKMKAILATLKGVHSATRIFGSESKKREKRYDIPEMDVSFGDREVVHPVIRTHPGTGRKLIYINRTYLRRFEGMTEEESRGLLETLYAHCGRLEFSCRARWRKDQVLVWDNRATWHRAIFDYPGKRRYLERVTIAGDRPY
jgi:taurine dioxygenase